MRPAPFDHVAVLHSAYRSLVILMSLGVLVSKFLCPMVPSPPEMVATLLEVNLPKCMMLECVVTLLERMMVNSLECMFRLLLRTFEMQRSHLMCCKPAERRA